MHCYLQFFHHILPTSSPVWLDLAKICTFYNILQVFGKFFMVYFLFGKMLSLLWQICYTIGVIFNVAYDQILKK